MSPFGWPISHVLALTRLQYHFPPLTPSALGKIMASFECQTQNPLFISSTLAAPLKVAPLFQSLHRAIWGRILFPVGNLTDKPTGTHLHNEAVKRDLELIKHIFFTVSEHCLGVWVPKSGGSVLIMWFYKCFPFLNVNFLIKKMEIKQ